MTNSDMETRESTIKGIFVKSHIKAVRVVKGNAGVRELEQRFDASLVFKNSDNVPVRDEARLIECAFDVLNDSAVNPHDRDREVGKLHFRNFMTTPLARIIFSLFRKNFRLMMLNAAHIAGHVYRGMSFDSEELSPTRVRVTMEDHNHYPLEHFKGFFEAWMEYAGVRGSVEAQESDDNHHSYFMDWHEE